MQLIVMLDYHARTHLSGGNRHKVLKLLAACVEIRKKIGLGPSFIVAQRQLRLGSKLLCGSDCREDIAHQHRRQGIALKDRLCEAKNPFTQDENGMLSP